MGTIQIDSKNQTNQTKYNKGKYDKKQLRIQGY